MKRILQITAVALLTIVFVGLFLWKSNLRDVGRILAATDLRWFIAALLVNAGALVFRSLRWRVIISRKDPPGFYPTFFANSVGYMLSTVLPIRAGDFARPALLSRRSNVRFATALGTVLTERVLDLIAITTLFVWFCTTHWQEWSLDPRVATPFLVVKSAAFVAGGILGALLLFMIGLYFASPRVRRLHQWVGRILPKRFREPWMLFFDAFVQTLEVTKDVKAFVYVILCTAGVWLCLTAQFYVAAIAAHRPLPFDAGYFLGGATTVGVAIPTPGGVGGFHKIAQWVLTAFYGFDIDSSVAVAIIFHLVGALPVIIIGLLLFAREGLKWREISNADGS
ncbi:MAG: hypothetical protein JWO56_636 [Acidobacteria bacterium]|nr:hypothetical protein [Acidobacteriota bacterium]